MARLVALCGLAVAAVVPPTAAIAADVDFFEPSGALVTQQGSLQGESPVLGITGFSGGVLAGFAHDPVIRRAADGTVTPAVSTLLPVHLQASWTQADLLRVDVLVPVYALVDAPMAGFSGPALGDVRVQATIPLIARSEAFGLAVVPRVEIPSGNHAALVSDGLSAAVVVALGGQIGHLGWLANAGADVARNEPLEAGAPGMGSRAVGLGSLWWRASDAVRLGAEADLSVGLAGGDGGRNDSAMAHGFAQAVLPSGFGLTLGGGTGILSGLGTPRYRLFGAVSFAATRHDKDHDGLVDADDGCPDQAEDRDGFEDADGCPDEDNDRDALMDQADLCPDEPEDPDGFEDADGCPDEDNDQDGLVDAADSCPDAAGTEAFLGCPDTDADGFADGIDACPDQPGVAAFGGCPDTDGDGIGDPDDACPDEPRPADEDVSASDGCPKAVFLTEQDIRIDQRIEFATGRETILSASTAVLDEIAQVLRTAPQVRRLEVQGHTDNVGPADYNQRLSQQRARAVVDYLVSQGIAAERLVARGYGESTPMFTNRTAAGRDANRRVQFVLLEVRAAPADPADGAAQGE